VPLQAAIISATISATVSVIGWLIAHGLTIRAQRKALQNQIINAARESVVHGIRKYQDWISDVKGFALRLNWAHDAEQSGIPQDWKHLAEEAMALFYERDDSLGWIFSLEEYEIVFPETREVRHYLQEKHRKIIIPAMGAMMDGILHAQNRPATLKRDYWGEGLGDAAAVSEYLRVWIQNASLGKLLGRAQPMPEPTMAGLSRLEMHDGVLKVVISDDKSARRGQAIQGPVNLKP